MKVHAEVLTSASSDTPGTMILVHFDSRRYVFGQFSEGSQRAFMERHVRLSKVSNLFLTGAVQWKNMGGLVGIILAMGDPDGTRTSSMDTESQKAVCGVSIHGGANLLYSLSTMRRFIFRTGMNLRVDEVDKNAPDYADENVLIRTLHVHPDGESPRAPDSKSKSFLTKAVNNMFCSSWTMNTMIESDCEDTTDPPPLPAAACEGAPEMHEGDECARDLQLSTNLPPKGKTRAPWPASTIESLPHTSPNAAALSYILQLHEQRGKFLPALAKKLGVKPGPDFSKLASGQSITTAAGKVVRPEDVMESPREGTGIAICDIPGPEYISNFVASPEWVDIGTLQRRIGCFFWLTAGNVISDPRFQLFVAAFPKSKHIISSIDVCPDRINFKGAAKSAVLLNSLDPRFFPEPRLYSERQGSEIAGFEVAVPGLRWQIEPKWQLRAETIDPSFDRQDIVQSEGYKSLSVAANEYQKRVSNILPQQSPGHDVEIYTLGTGSSIPSRHRNVSSTLVRIPCVGSMLLDCGEGTLGQLKRLFSGGQEELDQVLMDIKVIYISHLHADHHLGTISVLKLKKSLQPTEKIFVVGPWVFHRWLAEYTLAESGMDKVMDSIVFVPSEGLLLRKQNPETEILLSLIQSLCLSKIETANAIHCLSSFTVSFTFNLPGSQPEHLFKLSYSGDSRPSEDFVTIGQGSAVLIHEATFGDDMLPQAKAKRHSTVGEAVEIGRKMGAGAIVLTHFSQRYPKLAVASEGNNVVLAFDCMRIRVGDIGRFALLKRGLEELYREEEVE